MSNGHKTGGGQLLGTTDRFRQSGSVPRVIKMNGMCKVVLTLTLSNSTKSSRPALCTPHAEYPTPSYASFMLEAHLSAIECDVSFGYKQSEKRSRTKGLGDLRLVPKSGVR